jgi:UDP-N-acetylmuramoyl-tripeptide--D-alanyl-D-alanine ligase
MIIPGWQETISVQANVRDDFTLRQLVAATAVGVKLGMAPQEIAQGVASFSSLPGHMNRLDGVEGSVILDDTGNTSPLGVRTALQSLYRTPAPQRVAVLGSMRRLGPFAQTAHQEAGLLCDPVQLAWVVTVGDEANRWLAPAARGRGCQVKECANALDAGAFAHSVLEQGSVLLFNGHEEDLLEEGVKVVLRRASDSEQLARQSPSELQQKMEAFSRFS